MRAGLAILATCLLAVACGPAKADSPSNSRQDDPGFIVFNGYQPNRDASGFELWAMRPDGTELRRLAVEPFDDLSFSSGGDFIATATFLGDLMFVSRPDGSERAEVPLPDKDGVTHWPSVSPDGKKVAFVFAANQAFTGARNLWTVSVGDDDFRQVSSSGDVYDSAWSPDGTEIAFMDGETNGIYVVRPDGSESRHVAEGADPAWAPDGKRLAYSLDGSIRIVTTNGGSPKIVSRDGGRVPRWSSNGTQLAFLEATHVDERGQSCGEVMCNRVVILDLKSGKTRRVGPQLAEAHFLAWTTARIPTYVGDPKTDVPPPSSS